MRAGLESGPHPHAPSMSDALVGVAPATTPASSSAGASPWALARRRLARNKVAMAMLAVLAVIVLALPRGAALRGPHRTHGPLPLESRRNDRRAREDRSGDAAGIGRARARRDTDRPDVGSGALFPRRRQPGARRRGTAAVRRPQLAADRRLRSTPHVPFRHADRPRCGLLRRSRRRRAVASPRRRLGIPGVPVRDLPIDRADDQQPPRRAVHPRGGEPRCCRS